jgi:hypothetical protein
VHLAVGPGREATHQAGICLLASGLYQLTLQHVHCRASGSQQQGQQHAVNTLARVEPCYVLVAAGDEVLQ